MKLVGGSGSHEGNIFVGGLPVCDDGHDAKNAAVVCKMLGYLSGQQTIQSRFGAVPERFAMDNVECKGNESSLLDCPHLTKDDCGPDEGAGVICSNASCISNTCVSTCDQGWTQFGNKCYFWGTDMKKWIQAEDFCLSEGGHLASIPTQAVNTFVWKEMDARGKKFFWIGGNDLEEEGIWRWTDCTPWEFTFWYTGEPNNHGNKGQHCLYRNSGIKWDDTDCTDAKPFVCSKTICSGCIMENDISYWGQDIAGNWELESTQACADFCALTSNCRFWTWIPDGNNCYVKSSNSGRKERIGRVSGNKECGSAGV